MGIRLQASTFLPIRLPPIPFPMHVSILVPSLNRARARESGERYNNAEMF